MMIMIKRRGVGVIFRFVTILTKGVRLIWASAVHRGRRSRCCSKGEGREGGGAQDHYHLDHDYQPEGAEGRGRHRRARGGGEDQEGGGCRPDQVLFTVSGDLDHPHRSPYFSP